MVFVTKLFGKWKGIAIFPFILVEERKEVLINHEKIHLRQQLELLIIFFYLWYFIEWVFKGYENISFEKECYENQSDVNYLKTRKPYSFLKYLK